MRRLGIPPLGSSYSLIENRQPEKSCRLGTLKGWNGGGRSGLRLEHLSGLRRRTHRSGADELRQDFALDQLINFTSVQNFALQQGLGDADQHIVVGGQD